LHSFLLSEKAKKGDLRKGQTKFFTLIQNKSIYSWKLKKKLISSVLEQTELKRTEFILTFLIFLNSKVFSKQNLPKWHLKIHSLSSKSKLLFNAICKNIQIIFDLLKQFFYISLRPSLTAVKKWMFLLLKLTFTVCKKINILQASFEDKENTWMKRMAIEHLHVNV
jgi:hypothetical protein